MPVPDIDGLLRFSRQRDRSRSAIFVGRRAELARFAEEAHLTFDDWRHGRPVAGAALVVSGCPGMGKSALLEHFAREVCNQPDDPDSPLAIAMPIPRLLSEAAIADAVLDAAQTKSHPAHRLLDAMATVGEDVLTGFRIFKAERSAARIANAWREHAVARRPIVLLVDEAQNAEPEQNKAILSLLHEGMIDLPILPVFAGLNDTPDALRECGISRLRDDADMPLPRLVQGDARAAVAELMERHGVVGDTAAWIDAVAADSLGFPQHLHVGLATAAGVLAQNDGRAAPPGLRAARDHARQRREHYYESRLSPDVKNLGAEVLGKFVTALQGWNRMQMTRNDAADMLLNTADRTRRPFAVAQADQLVKRMIHDGVLQERGCRFEVPIPSMAAWLQERSQQGRTPVRPRSKPDFGD